MITPLQGLASIAAGAIHAAAAGIHSDHPTLSRLFVAVAAAQILVGLVTLLRGGRAAAAATAIVNGAAVCAWIITRVVGISWIDGLEQSEPARFADTVCAALGAVAVGAAVVSLRRGAGRTRRPISTRVTAPAIALCAITVAAMVSGATHAHSAESADDHGHDAAPVAYDPTQPIDLSGIDGVTPEQQAFAENLVAVNVVRLPQWSDPAVAEAAGFRSIGDADTGHEHYVQWDWIDDDVWLDPDAPESLVYAPQPDGSKKLVSAMYMLPEDVTLEEVPDYGGTLMQWHIHDDLCLTDDPVAPQVEDITDDGTCRPGLVKLAEWAMIHVWIVPHECGPFASLEGGGAGAILEGEQRWCDHAHGVPDRAS
jgi:hypothetical protein